MKHNKNTLVNAISKEIEQSKSTTALVLESFFRQLNMLEEGEKLELREFGVFERKRTKTKGKHNPVTGAKVEPTTFTTLRFKPSKTLRTK